MSWGDLSRQAKQAEVQLLGGVMRREGAGVLGQTPAVTRMSREDITDEPSVIF